MILDVNLVLSVSFKSEGSSVLRWVEYITF